MLPLAARRKKQRLGDDMRHEFRQRRDVFRLPLLEVAQTAAVGEALLDGDRRFVAREFGQVFGNGIVHGELARLLHHHHGGGSDRLGHGGDPENRIDHHRCLVFNIGKPDCGKVEDMILVRDHGHCARDFLAFHEGLHFPVIAS